MIFDTHAHYDDAAFDADRDELIASLPEHGIGCVIDVGASADSQQKILEMVDKYDNIYGALGVHPDEVGDIDEALWQVICEGLNHPKIVAVGEIGLDYYWDKEGHDVQEKYFREQIELAMAKKLPILVHSREAAEDTMRILREYYGRGGVGESIEHKGIIHCYSYSVEQAREYVKMGFYLGIGGVVTFANAKKLKQVVEAIPLTSLLLETDAPYLAPKPHRGKRNSSLYLPYVVEQIAALKGISAQEVEEATWQQAAALFGL